MRNKGKLFIPLVVAVVLLAAMAGSYFKLEQFSAQKVREFTSRYEDIARIDFRRVLINPLDRSLHVWSIDCDFAVGSGLSARKIVIESFDRKHSFPRFFKGTVQGVSIPVDSANLGTLAGDFRKMGYDKLNFDLSADYIYEDETRCLSVKEFSFEGTDLCRVKAGFDLGDVKLQSPGLGGIIGVSVLNGSMVLQDLSLVGRLLGIAAAAEPVEPSAYRRRVLDLLQLNMQKAKSLGNGYAENFYAELNKFIENPGRLAVRVKPAEPVPLLYMFMGRSFEELLELYGVTAEAGS